METRPGTDRGASFDPSVQSKGSPAPKASVFEDFIDIFYAPSTVFARREKSGFGLQMLIISVLAAVFGFANRAVISQVSDAEFTRRMAKMANDPRMTEQVINMQRSINDVITMILVYAGTPIGLFFLGVVLWIVAKIASAKVTYGQAVLIMTLAWIPRLLGSLVGTVLALVTDTTNYTSWQSLGLSPARFMDPATANPKVFAAVGTLDPFGIWSLVLVGIGLAVIGKVSRQKGYIVAGVLFALMLIPALFA